MGSKGLIHLKCLGLSISDRNREQNFFAKVGVVTINALITHLQDLEAVLSVSDYSYSSSFALFISHSSKASGSPEALLFFLRLCFDLGPSGPHVTSLAGLFATLALGAWRGQRNHSRPGSRASALVTCRPVSPLRTESPKVGKVTVFVALPGARSSQKGGQ